MGKLDPLKIDLHSGDFLGVMTSRPQTRGVRDKAVGLGPNPADQAVHSLGQPGDLGLGVIQHARLSVALQATDLIMRRRLPNCRNTRS